MKNVTINKVELQGRIGTVRIQSIDDKLVANFSVCTEKFHTDNEANRIIEVMWHHVCIWEGQGRNLGGLSRGVLVHVTGQLRHQKYFDATGNERIFTEVLADTIAIINESDSPEDFRGD